MSVESKRKPLHSVSYRYDLDGLRGIAIAFVVIFHVFVGKVSGGVDIFLLLSGFFFFGSQLRYASRASANLNPWWPLWRTIRRLVPALVTVLAVVTVAVLIFTPQLRSGDLLSQLIASLFYYQNWELAAQNADYAAASEAVSPLQHLWSMSVQGQFYLLSIMLIVGIAAIFRRCNFPAENLRRLLGPVLILITILSFCYAWWIHGINQSLNYYSTFSRLWELSLGAVLALYIHQIRLPRMMSVIGAFLGLAMVLSTGLIFDGALLFPGPAAIYPIGGAVLLILGAGPVSRMLAAPAMRWLGDIAYPLYLWHWPLLILVTVELDQSSPSVPVGIAVIAISLALAQLTQRYIEKPLAQHRKRPVAGEYPVHAAFIDLRGNIQAQVRAAGGVAVAAMIVAMLSLQPIYQHSRQVAVDFALDPIDYPGARALLGVEVPEVDYAPDPDVIAEIYPRVGDDACMAFTFDDADFFPETSKNDEPCVYGDITSTREVYLVGGSHAEQWSTALDIIGQHQGFKLIPLLRQTCPLFIDTPDEDFDDACLEWNHNAINRIIDAQPDLVISTTTRPSGYNSSGPDVVPDYYVSVWDTFEEHGIAFLGLRDNPWGFDEDLEPQNRTACIVAGGDAVSCGSPRADVYALQDPAAAVLNHRPRMRAVDTADWFCTIDHCPAVIGNIFVYRDVDHLSTDYVNTLIDPLAREISNLIGF